MDVLRFLLIEFVKIDKLKWGWEVLAGINSPTGTGMGKKLSPMTFAGMGTGTGVRSK
jgi:hypothetical protein